MADHLESERVPVGFPHQVLERLTVMKLLVRSLQERLRLGTITGEELATQLTHLDHEIDATATLAQDMQAQEARSA